MVETQQIEFLSLEQQWDNFCKAAKENDKARMRSYINARLDINATNMAAWPVLNYAIRGGWIKSATWLIKKGANVHHEDRDRSTPLHLAAINNHPTIVKLLLRKGADAEKKDVHGFTALDYVEANFDWKKDVLDYAEKRKFKKILTMLRAAMPTQKEHDKKVTQNAKQLYQAITRVEYITKLAEHITTKGYEAAQKKYEAAHTQGKKNKPGRKSIKPIKSIKIIKAIKPDGLLAVLADPTANSESKKFVYNEIKSLAKSMPRNFLEQIAVLFTPVDQKLYMKCKQVAGQIDPHAASARREHILDILYPNDM